MKTVAVAILTALALASPAQAIVQYVWTGQCLTREWTGEEGVPGGVPPLPLPCVNTTLTLTFVDGYDGGPFGGFIGPGSPLLEMSYEGDDILGDPSSDFKMYPISGNMLEGLFFAEVAAGGSDVIHLFITPDGFDVEAEMNRPDYEGRFNEHYRMTGLSTGFVRVPEPSPAWLLLATLPALVLARSSRRRQAQQ